jgi:hypothetical protein
MTESLRASRSLINRLDDGPFSEFMIQKSIFRIGQSLLIKQRLEVAPFIIVDFGFLLKSTRKAARDPIKTFFLSPRHSIINSHFVAMDGKEGGENAIKVMPT